MVFYVTVVIFLMTLLVSKFIKKIQPKLHLLVHSSLPIIKTMFGMFFILTILIWNINVMDDWYLDDNHLVSDSNCNIFNM